MSYQGMRAALAASVAIYAVAAASPVWAQVKSFDVPSQPAATGIPELARQADIQILVSESVVRGRTTRAVKGQMSVEQALRRLIAGTGLRIASSDGRTFTLSAGATATSSQENTETTSSSGGASPVAGEAVAGGDQEIIVVGSNLRGGAPTGSSVQVFDAAEIIATGRTTTSEFLETLPQNLASVSADNYRSADTANFNTAAGTAINLRGLGVSSTLVLVNGHRVATAGLAGRFVDISTIPLRFVDRIEVLTDGGSAVYGADAVGGVVNFVLKTRFDGVTSSGSFGTDTKGSTSSIDLTQGMGTSWRNGGAMISLNYRNEKGLNAMDRAFSRASGNTGITPDFEGGSVLGSLDQSIGASLNLHADLHYSARNVSIITSAFGSSYDTAAKSRQITGHGTLSADLGRGWELSIAGTAGRGISEFKAGTFGGRESETTLQTYSAKVDGTLIELPGGALRVATGLERRVEGLDATGSGSYATGTGITKQSRSVNAAFAEFSLPLVGDANRSPLLQRVVVSAAARYERYGGLPAKLSPRAGVVWSPVAGVDIRGSFSKSFRVPQFTDLYAGAYSYLTNVPGPGGQPAVAFQLDGENRDLRPENARSYSFGVDLKPSWIDGLSGSISYFNISFRDRIASPGIFLLDPLGDARFTSFIDQTPNVATLLNIASTTQFGDVTALGGPYGPQRQISDTTIFVDNRIRNIARTDTDGIDASLAYRIAAPFGAVRVGGSATYLLHFRDKLQESEPSVDLKNTFGKPNKFRGVAFIEAISDRFTARTSVNHIGSYQRTLSSAEEIPSWTTFDFHGHYRFGRERQITLSVDGRNIFNKAPPYIDNFTGGGTNLGFDPASADPYGRVLTVSFAVDW